MVDAVYNEEGVDKYYNWEVSNFAACGQNCVGRVDGVYDAGCRAYTTCKSGVGTITECSKPMVFNRLTNQCDEWVQLENNWTSFKDI